MILHRHRKLRVYFLALLCALTPERAMCGWGPDFDVSFLLGYGRSTISSQSSTLPQTTQYVAAAAMSLVSIAPFGFGVLTDYRQVYQISAADDTRYGNRAGSRWNMVSPFAELRINRRSPIRLRVAYQFTGDYVLRNKTASGDSISYGNPKGFRGEFTFCLISSRLFYIQSNGCSLYAGMFAERVRFGTESRGTRPTPDALVHPLLMQHIGLIMGVDL